MFKVKDKINYTTADKVDYYSQRANDPKISPSARYYAKERVKDLTSNQWNILSINDDYLNSNYSKPNRRVVVVNENTNGHLGIAKITSLDGKEKKVTNGQITPIIQTDKSALPVPSGVNNHYYIEDGNGQPITREKLSRVKTPSGQKIPHVFVHPFDRANVRDGIFNNDNQYEVSKHNRIKRDKILKDK